MASANERRLCQGHIAIIALCKVDIKATIAGKGGSDRLWPCVKA